MVESMLRYIFVLLCLHLIAEPVLSQRESGSESLAAIGKHDEFERSLKGGCRAEIYLRDQGVMYGDLLSVQDSSVSLFVYSEFSYSISPRIRSGVHNFRFRDVERLVVLGDSKVLPDLLMGFLGGMAMGVVATRIADPHTTAETMFGPAALGGVGLLAGGIIGYLSSGRDLEISSFSSDELKILRALCRYPEITHADADVRIPELPSDVPSLVEANDKKICSASNVKTDRRCGLISHTVVRRFP